MSQADSVPNGSLPPVPSTARECPWKPDVGLTLVVNATAFFNGLVCIGLPFSVGIYFEHLKHVFETSSAAAAVFASVGVGTMLGTGPFSSYVAEKLGSHRMTMMIGSILATIGLTTSYFANGIWVLVGTYGVLTGLGLSLVFTPTVSYLEIFMNHYPNYQKFAIGILMSGMGFGNAIFPFLIPSCIDFAGWRGSFILMGGVVLNCLVTSAFMRPAYIHKFQFDQSGSADSSGSVEHCKVFTDWRLLLIYLSSIVWNGFGATPFIVIVDYAVQSGIERTSASLLVSVLGLSNGIGSLFGGIIASHPRVNITAIQLVCCALLSVSVGLYAAVSGLALLIVVSIAVGLSMGFVVACIPLIVHPVVRKSLIGFAIGSNFMACGIGIAFIPPVLNMLSDARGYSTTLLVGGCVCVLSSLVLIPLLVQQLRRNRVEGVSKPTAETCT